ncbi:hypothetical protein [Fusibacter ferrireducens]|uniref:Uncharacterized protein n=1 Tax=Fusibacter ferrireducens TaxID=2785058 RepID=A0ABR9ZNU2_9FIRM|nr:hypothetical protein [Fusibacter ferrireducens]MBF4692138.1 hypothetical protein [Fusibacter ferrireducens]
MTSGYKRIFWGIFIATFNIKIGMMTILPAFIGWIIVVTGISELEKKGYVSTSITSKKVAMTLVVVSLGSELLRFLGGELIMTLLPLLFYPLFLLGLEFVVFHKILEASIQYFAMSHQEETADLYTDKDRLYLALMGITMVLFIISLTFNHETIGHVGVFAAMISRLYLLITFNALSKETHKSEQEIIHE